MVPQSLDRKHSEQFITVSNGPVNPLENWPCQILPRAYLGNEDEAVDGGCANKDSSGREAKDQVGPGVQVSGDHKKKPSSQHHKVDSNHDG